MLSGAPERRRRHGELVPRELLRTTTQIRGEVAGVLEARRLLEPRVAQLAAVHAGEDDFAAMQATIERQRELAAAGDFLKHEDSSSSST